jgi:beta-lactam-binding protein with PASTA domain
MIIAFVVVGVLVLLAGGALTGFLTYRAEVWGGKILPDPASIARVTDDKDGAAGKNGKPVVKARDVTEALKAKGLNTKTVSEFSGQAKGVFLGYRDARQGDRVKEGGTVAIRESAGPGVPKGTVGKKADQVVDTFAAMGVPVRYKQVIVGDTKKIPEGSVAATHPADGQAVADDESKNGITIGVATKGEGVPVDIMGSDKGKAVDELKSQGYQVDLQPHYSSKQYIGKISGSYPAPGSTLKAGQSVTLYYGVDKTSNMDLFTSEDYGYRLATDNATPTVGKYCKSEVKDASKDCITLEETGRYRDSDKGYLQIKGHEPSNPLDALGLRNYSTDISLAFVDADSVPEGKLALKNHLLLKDWGMFELYAGMDLPNCDGSGTTSLLGADCDNGIYVPPGGTNIDDGPSDLTYEMKDFLVYFPAGADLKPMEDSGYFDAGSLAEAKKQKAVDSTRPFILMRDKTQYDTTSVSAVDGSAKVDPFVPTNSIANDYTNAMVPMKPAPSDSTVYYLVESAEPDWDSLPDANVGNADAGGKDSGDGGAGNGEGNADEGEKAKAKAESDAQAQAQAQANAAMFQQIAGQYRNNWTGGGTGYTDLTVSPDGSFSGEVNVANPGPHDSNATAPRATSPFTGRFASIAKNASGGYDMVCDASSFSIQTNPVDSSGGGGIEPCGTFHWYPANTPFSSMSGAENMAQTMSSIRGQALTSVDSPMIFNEGIEFSSFVLEN